MSIDRVTLTIENSVFSDSHYLIDDENYSLNDLVARLKHFLNIFIFYIYYIYIKVWLIKLIYLLKYFSIGANEFHKIVIKNSVIKNSGNTASGGIIIILLNYIWFLLIYLF